MLTLQSQYAQTQMQVYAHQALQVFTAELTQVLKRVNAPGVQPIKHEQENENNQPEIGTALLLLSTSLLLVNLRESVDEGDGQDVGNQNRCQRVKE